MNCPSILVALSLALLRPAYAQQPTVDPGMPPAKQAAMAGNKFAFSLLARLGEGNQVLAPHSLRTAFAMCLLATEGATHEEIRRVLGFDAGDAAHAQMQALQEQLGGISGKGAALLSANRLWGTAEPDYFEPGFLAQIEARYGAGLGRVEFGQVDAARRQINEWVAERTGDHVAELLPDGSISPRVAMVLTNAVYLQAGWALPFDPRDTAPMGFQLTAGERVEVQAMARRGTYAMGSMQLPDGMGCRAIALPYVGGRLRMLVAMADPDRPLAELVEALDEQVWARLRAGLREVEIQLRLPKFTMGRSYALHQGLLPALGMRAPFALSRDWRPCNGEAGEELRISGVFHGATIDVDEQGTEATGATAIVVEKRSMPREVAIDRPFVFAIEDVETGAILFLGQVCDPRTQQG